jgi:lipid-binding SYLF domain-containing protein
MKQKALFVCLLGASLTWADDHQAKRITEANAVFNEIMASPDKGIPEDLLQRAHCAVIVPSLKRGGFIVGAQYGVGVALCRGPKGTGWTGPSTVRMEGGSLGLQLGAGETDLIMLVMNEAGSRKLMKSEFTIGADAAAMAGPVGRQATAETDALMRAEILSYSRSRGIFAGIALKGSTLRSDDEANAKIYGKPVTHAEILEGKVPAPAVAKDLRATLGRYSPAEEGAPRKKGASE